ncbi:MAG: 16S rRNA (cytosine(1402)-N(4))-methyltransferase RsmH [Gammaproteobacteria bacterium]|jgi:16S rRNA (cytosine1402-N4)-methyltransferase|nr:16S rRNA (cytosine(1402)-N(4))-methyltransferase [Gammaproteobacteria bacterium]MBQ09048.1 16S rRNA (cytosine(1402)-N(4))-methyltransferase [Gammaproteobacteria bacterium]MDP6146850.1 16S rRNA (cytosine(1402)-N(4))-methyltransferase RsmH [Gammaproteobacteria bacterium]HJL79953.1 16S rRNA (cytosine(1402)-N(4))-methyltransferase RsmH [Gammaproteobacteria bacterium]HJN00497.1 16S rRNA (cytosine(1402)-N(4))-methyltransferase RsmH [Gammaproteobacteria bacterium]|tara:strand:- start:5593 stop:6510 length:918 start_codon:yes stop_codon:yes gene_type:complete
MVDESFHIPVLTEEVIQHLIQNADGDYLDATGGFGGHSAAILGKIGCGSLIATDRDPEAIKYLNSKFKAEEKISIHQACFSELTELFRELEFDGILADIGVSSYQLDNASRGFSFKQNGPLDMRMNQSIGQDASQWLNNASEKEISNVIWKYGEEKKAKKIAKIIVEARINSEIKSTKELAEIILEEIPRKFNDKKHPATKTFQAIRIFINNELLELEILLEFIAKHLKIGGRACIISFHSLEDRMVKRFFRDKSRRDPKLSKLPNLPDDSSFKLVSKALKPSDNEVNDNPRSRSATLRVIEKIK